MKKAILAIDQGTTSSRAIVFDTQGNKLGLGQQEFSQHFPHDGWVEHDPEDIWQSTLDSCKTALQQAGLKAQEIACIGITNQRETTLLWDRNTGIPVYNAIVWQDRRSSDSCEELKRQGHEQMLSDKTGLLLDPYFSATKLAWILDNVSGARAKAERGELAFGTVDCFLLWRLTGGRSHFTDASNASRTLLFNIHTQQWDSQLLQLFNIPDSVLPEVLDNAADFGDSDEQLLGASIAITGMAGDQQAAAFGQACFKKGMTKSTYGTGCFMLMNTGTEVLASQHRLLSTVAYRLQGKTSYAIEGSIFMAGATMQWLRDGLHLIDHASESEALARQTDINSKVYLVPAFTGLGAPYWDAQARGALYGLTRDTGIKEIVTAALMSVCYQSRDLMEAIVADGTQLSQLRVDGGMSANNFVMQALADLLDCAVDRPKITETTALGVAYLAGLHCGLFDSLADIEANWQLERRFEPQQDARWRDSQYQGWLEAVRRTLSTGASVPERVGDNSGDRS